MLGINGYELIILVVLALVILGPERLPQYAQTLAEWVRKARGMAEDAKQQFKEETGADFEDVDWKKYDPRQYDPRRIIREALAEDFESTRRAVGEVRDAARIEAPRLPRSGAGRAGGRRSGQGPRTGSSGSSRTASSAAGSAPRTSPSRGAGTDSSAAQRAGTAGAAKRSDAPDPREVFGSRERDTASGALAAGLAGAAVAGSPQLGTGEVGDETQDAPQPAPFDIDAT
ncbi:Sec-independent protein translocase TatB [Nesterenkonia xinjiangensis]|uniref:Sec-independent protein translocase protein TatB n=1 Tax=Nesterenkonia xinjiangensis TaxID=225327 RepID=A0A7Z0K9N2_9MICC|nr:Sec-independent protein translocase TatB [Nesterenkonia xinjiangensis]NYJ78876.1 sec-independent protein translocase protein TatB [Nesterenkonia xinjiangensis]